MTDIDDLLDDVGDRAQEFLNSEGRSPAHVAGGIIVTVGFVLLATSIASGALHPPRRTTRQLARREAPTHEKPRGPFSLVLPALFSATTLAAVRVWNAPTSAVRTSAMGLWFVAQAVNAVWLGLRPASRWGQIAAAVSSSGLAAAFAFEARRLDEGAGKIAAPTGVGVRVANFLGRKTDSGRHERHTLH